MVVLFIVQSIFAITTFASVFSYGDASTTSSFSSLNDTSGDTGNSIYGDNNASSSSLNGDNNASSSSLNGTNAQNNISTYSGDSRFVLSTDVKVDADGGIFKRYMSELTYQSLEVMYTDGYDGKMLTADFWGPMIFGYQHHVTAVKSGFDFFGIYSQKKGNGVQYYTQYFDPTTNNWKQQDTTLYAYWRYTEQTILLDQDGGAGGNPSIVVRKDEYVPNITNMPSIKGKMFDGYWSTKDNSGKKYIDANGNGVSFWDDSSNRLYAHYVEQTYTVTLDPNGGSGGAEVTVKYNQKLPSASKPTNGDKQFAGYFSYQNVDDGSGSYYDANMNGSVWDKVSNGILYAKWVDNVYTVTLNAMGGSGGTTTQVVQGQDMPGGLEIPQKQNWIFLGYFEYDDGTGTHYYNSEMISMTKYQNSDSITIYAAWTQDIYTVTLDFNDQDVDTPSATGGTVSVSVAVGNGMPMSSEIVAPTRKGYSFLGYFDDDGTNDPYADQYYSSDMKSLKMWSIADNHTLYAHWHSDKFLVKLVANGGEFFGGADSITGQLQTSLAIEVVGGDKLVLDGSIPAPTRQGYIFLGFWDDDTLGVQYIDANMTSTFPWEKNEDGILFARWAMLRVAVSFDLGGGKFLDADGNESDDLKVEMLFNGAFPSLTPPTKKDYTFAGFFDSDGVQYVGSDMGSIRLWDRKSDTTLYAKWNPYTPELPINLALIIMSALGAGCLLAAGYLAIRVVRKHKKNKNKGNKGKGTKGNNGGNGVVPYGYM